MPGDPKQPVTVGSLWFLCEHGKTETHQLRLGLSADCPGGHPATVADLVSALRAEGVLVVEKLTERDEWAVYGDWPAWAVDAYEACTAGYADAVWIVDYLDALAEASAIKGGS